MKAWVMGLLAVLTIAVAASPASAVPTLRFIVDGGAAVDCADGSACDGAAAPGAVAFVGTLGTFSVNVVVGATKPALGGGDNPNLLLDTLNVESAGGMHSLVILFSEVDFTLPTSFSLVASGSGGFGPPGSGSNVGFTAHSDASNTLFGTASLIGALGPFDLSGISAFAGSAGGSSSSTTPYSLTGIISLSTNGTGSWSGELALTNAPEPGTLLLLGSGLLGITVATWRGRRGSK